MLESRNREQKGGSEKINTKAPTAVAYAWLPLFSESGPLQGALQEHENRKKNKVTRLRPQKRKRNPGIKRE
jgi:hypothetical protein